MALLQEIGLFTIWSERIDNYVPDWVFPVGAMGFVGIMIGMCLHLFMLFGGVTPSEWRFWILITIGLSLILLFAPQEYYKNKCGVSISLNGTNTSLTSKFTLSNNVNRDAKKIKKIVDKYVKIAHQIDAAEKSKELSERNLKQECCTRYNEVIQKVKSE